MSELYYHMSTVSKNNHYLHVFNGYMIDDCYAIVEESLIKYGKDDSFFTAVGNKVSAKTIVSESAMRRQLIDLIMSEVLSSGDFSLIKL